MVRTNRDDTDDESTDNHRDVLVALSVYGDVEKDAVAVTLPDDPDRIASAIDRAHRHGYVVDESRDATDDLNPVERRLRFVRAEESDLDVDDAAPEAVTDGGIIVADDDGEILSDEDDGDDPVDPDDEGVEVLTDGGVPDKRSAIDHVSEGDRVTVEYQDADREDQSIDGDVVDTNDARDPGRTHAGITIDTDDGDRYRVMFGGGVHEYRGNTWRQAGHFADVTVHDPVTDGGDVDKCDECGLYAAHVFDHAVDCSKYRPIEAEPDVDPARANPRMAVPATDGSGVVDRPDTSPGHNAATIAALSFEDTVDVWVDDGERKVVSGVVASRARHDDLTIVAFDTFESTPRRCVLRFTGTTNDHDVDPVLFDPRAADTLTVRRVEAR